MTNLYKALHAPGTLLLLLASALGSPLAGYAQYTPGNLVVVQVGEGATLTGATTTTTLVEYTPAGVFQSMIRLNATGTNKLTNTGSSNSEGMLTLSADGQYLLTTGYDAPVGTTASTATAAAVPRMVARIASNQIANYLPALTDAFSNGGIRSAASLDGSTLWLAGASSTIGLRYAVAGATTSSSLSTTVASARVVRLFQGNVYFSTASGTPGIYLLGRSDVTTAGQTATSFISTGAGTSPYSFILLDRNSAIPGPDVAYIADDVSGIGKWAFNGSTWNKVGAITPAVRGLTGTINPDGSVTLFATTRTSDGGNELVTSIDSSPYNMPPSSNAAISRFKAPANVALRGVEFAPGTAVVLPVVLTSFGASRTAAGVRLHWATASEKNSARFEVQRSLDGRTFTTVASLVAAGSSQLARTYAAADEAAPGVALYYRLRQTDQDGTAEYSPVVTVAAGTGLLTGAYPNPTRDVVTLAAGQLAEVRDLQGRVVLRATVPTDGQLHLAGLAAGTYLLTLDGTSTRRISKVE